MPSSELLLPVPMSRIALVAPRSRLRDALVSVAGAANVELVGAVPAAGGEQLETLRRVEQSYPGRVQEPACVSATPIDLSSLENAGARGMLAGEVELARRAAMARERGSFAVLVGWTPRWGVVELEDRLDAIGGGVVELPRPAWVDPPTLFTSTPVRRSFRPLVTTYGVTPYADVDPTPFAAVSFVVMFGIMFGDVGHGLVLTALGLVIRRTRRTPLRSFQSFWPFLVASGVVSAFFGLLYGEAFGPTGLVPTLWLRPVDRPGPLLVAAVAVGVLMLSGSHIYGIINRWRETGPAAALLSQTGVAGLTTLLGAALAALGSYVGLLAAVYAGLFVLATGGLLLAAGFVAAAGGGVGLVQAGIELIDALVRIASNVLSFTRLAAFGLMHAALGAVVLAAAAALWGGVIGAILASVVFLIGNGIAFSLELLVTGIQALRLEYYELFSRVFAGEGHPFLPWALPVITKEEP
jgi:V/A-type H+/Na+-transporting ATPase subunit I